jgi:hypothetical protein
MPAFTDRLNIPIPALGEDPWRSTYVDAFLLVDEILGRIQQAGGLTFVRRWQSSGGWPSRGDVPAGSSVIWVKPAPHVSNPSTGGTGMQTGTDLVVVAVE